MKQQTLFPVPKPDIKVDRRTVRLVKRTRLAFVRLCDLVENADDLELPAWFLKLVRRLRQDLSDLRNATDPEPAWQLRLAFMHATKAERKQRRKRQESRRPSKGAQQRIRGRLLSNWDGRCRYCRKPTNAPTLDHVIPVSKGGSNTDDNAVIACDACNQVKADRSPQEWANDILGRPHRRRWTVNLKFWKGTQ